MQSNVRRVPAAVPALAIASALTLLAFLAGCARETPEVREVRKLTQDYFRALSQRDVKEIAERSTCLVSTNSLVGGRVLRVDPPRRVRMATLDSLARALMRVQKTADSAWAAADEANADSLFRRARTVSNQASVYRNALRAVHVSAPGTVVGRDSTLETRAVRARVRYAGPVIGPKPIDREQIVRLLRAPGGKWVVFSVYTVADDPQPEMI
ncbi:MAG TPA: hypothetical protein VGJ98_00925 [Candidatus Eisenbacteria bacterium]